jgi:ATP:ADP antiporter, AAA family
MTFRSSLPAMLCAAAVTAQFVGGKATRDALFLTSLGLGALPTILIVASLCSIILVAGHTRWAAVMSPARLLQFSSAAAGFLFLAEWLVSFKAPAATAVILYLHTSAMAPLLVSGFWLLATEGFDPRTAKRRFGQIAGAGTLGGLLGAIASERVAATLGAPAMLLFLAGSHFLTIWLISLCDSSSATSATRGEWRHSEPVLGTSSARSDLRVIAAAPHLRHLAVLVLLGTTSAALLDYLFKAKAVETLGHGDQLLRFFALYYAAISAVTFVFQVASSRAVLDRFGIALTTSTPSIALLAGSIGALIVPGFGSLMIGRASESIFRGSWFRAGYELFYTPIPVREKRAVKSIVDVGVDRLGDAVGGGLVRLTLLMAPAAASSIVLWIAMACSAVAVVAASRLHHWYVQTLGTSLVRQAAGAPPAETMDASTRNVLRGLRKSTAIPAPLGALRTVDPELQDVLALRSSDNPRAIEILTREDGLTATLVPHVIPLLAAGPLADYALFALRKVAEERVGQLTDALLDPNLDYAVRRRLPRVLSVCVSQRAADALILVLDDPRFEVRFQSARSLAAIHERNPHVRMDRDRILEVVLQEVAVGKPVWESRCLLDGFVNESPLDAFVRNRAGQSLAHVFTLLSLVLPSEPLQIAFRSLHSEDRRLRGTALEYLETVLPPAIRQRLWPYLVEGRPRRPVPPHSEIIASLLRANPSVTLQGIASQAG